MVTDKLIEAERTVFKTKIRFSSRGMKIISKADRAELVNVLDRVCKHKGYRGLSDALEVIMSHKYGSSGNKQQIKNNIEAYVEGRVGVGMSLLTDLCEKVGITSSVVIMLPGKDCILTIYEGRG